MVCWIRLTALGGLFRYNIPLFEQKTKIYQAIEQNNIQYVKDWLLDNPSQEYLNQVYLEKNIDDKNKKPCKKSLLFLAIEKQHDEIAKMLLDTHAIYANWKNHQKENTALFASKYGTQHIYNLVLNYPKINLKCLKQKESISSHKTSKRAN